MTKQVHRHRATCQTKNPPRFVLSVEEREKLTPAEIKEREMDALCRFGFPRPAHPRSILIHELPRVLREENVSFPVLIFRFD